MDETDIILTKLLLANSRTPYRQLADQFGLSVNAVHKRIQSLKNLGVIHSFNANISHSVLKTISVYIFGKSDANSLSHIHETLGSHECTYWVSVASGNYLYVGAFLQSITDLESYVKFVQNEAKLPDPTVGFLHSVGASHNSTVGVSQSEDSSDQPLSTELTLYPLDYQIIYSLTNNSRKPYSDIAEELGVSAKTIRRRLSRLVDENLIELSLEWYPDKSNDIMTIFHLNRTTSIDKITIDHIIQKYAPNVIYPIYFSNLPNLILCVVWTNNIKDLRAFQERFEAEQQFDSIVTNILYSGNIYKTWRDDLLEEKGKPTQNSSD